MTEKINSKSFDLEDEEARPEDEVSERLLREIADDAQKSPQQWLRDAEVPKGGE